MYRWKSRTMQMVILNSTVGVRCWQVGRLQRFSSDIPSRGTSALLPVRYLRFMSYCRLRLRFATRCKTDMEYTRPGPSALGEVTWQCCDELNTWCWLWWYTTMTLSRPMALCWDGMNTWRVDVARKIDGDEWCCIRRKMLRTNKWKAMLRYRKLVWYIKQSVNGSSWKWKWNWKGWLAEVRPCPEWGKLARCGC